MPPAAGLDNSADDLRVYRGALSGRLFRPEALVSAARSVPVNNPVPAGIAFSVIVAVRPSAPVGHSGRFMNTLGALRDRRQAQPGRAILTRAGPVWFTGAPIAGQGAICSIFVADLRGGDNAQVSPDRCCAHRVPLLRPPRRSSAADELPIADPKDVVAACPGPTISSPPTSRNIGKWLLEGRDRERSRSSSRSPSARPPRGGSVDGDHLLARRTCGTSNIIARLRRSWRWPRG